MSTGRTSDRCAVPSLSSLVLLHVVLLRQGDAFVVGQGGDVGLPPGTPSRMPTPQAAEERFRIVLESLPGSVFVHDLEGKILIVNDEACLATGYSKEELLSVTVGELEPDSFKTDDARKMWKQLSSSILSGFLCSGSV